MSTQPELFKPPRENADVAWFENLLHGANCWLSAKDIALSTGGKVGERDARALASASGKILSGQKGYKHIAHATAEEVNHAAAWLESQARTMSERAGRLRREAHKIFG